VKDKVALVAAIIVTGIYVVFVALLWNVIDDQETVWGRRLLLFSGLEAIAFAGVGWLFGKEVNRGAADAAVEANGRATDEAAARGSVQGRGEALAAAVRSASETGGLESAPASAGGSLRALADELFPASDSPSGARPSGRPPPYAS
jgi:hypothetical protein